jgi:hypothetical protein
LHGNNPILLESHSQYGGPANYGTKRLYQKS